MKHYENFIDGKFVAGDHKDQQIPVFNPATEAQIRAGPGEQCGGSRLSS